MTRIDTHLLPGDQILATACDNASANDTMIVKLAQILPAFKGEKSRVQCFLHIVNLIAKAIIRQFNASKGGLEVEEDEGEDESGNEVDEVDDDDNDNGDDNGDDDDAVLESIQPVRVVLNKVRTTPRFSADVS